MRELRYITSSLIALLLTFTDAAQSRAYAKFDNNGVIIGLFNLANVDDSCRDTQTIAGTTRNLKVELRDPDIAFSFTLVSGGRSRTIGFSLKKDAIPRSDIENLLTNKGRFRLNVSACHNGNRWIAKEITRL
jgi:hypothetical protein